MPNIALVAPDAPHGVPAQLGPAITRVPVYAPLAMFAPDHLLHVPQVPLALSLLMAIPVLPTNREYATDANGLVRDAADRILRHEIQLPGRGRVRLKIEGSQEYGLPTVTDMEFLLALLRLRYTGALGERQPPSWAQWIEATGRVLVKENRERARLAANRWNGLLVTANVELWAGDDVPTAAPALAVSSSAERAGALRTVTEHTYRVLEFAARIEDLAGGGQAHHILKADIAPVWRVDAGANPAAWVNVDVFCQLTDPIAKRLLLFGTQEVLAGRWGLNSTLTKTEEVLIAALGGLPHKRPARRPAALQKALDELQARGVLSYERLSRANPNPRLKTPVAEYRLTAGAAIVAQEVLQRVDPTLPARERAIVVNLLALGVPSTLAHEWVVRDPAWRRTVLRYAYWLMEVHGGRLSVDSKVRTESWDRWLRAASSEWDFSRPDFIAWCDAVERGEVALRHVITPLSNLDAYLWKGRTAVATPRPVTTAPEQAPRVDVDPPVVTLAVPSHEAEIPVPVTAFANEVLSFPGDQPEVLQASWARVYRAWYHATDRLGRMAAYHLSQMTVVWTGTAFRLLVDSRARAWFQERLPVLEEIASETAQRPVACVLGAWGSVAVEAVVSSVPGASREVSAPLLPVTVP